MRAVEPVGARDAPRLAALHAQAFDRPWDARAFADLLSSPGVAALATGDEGFILVRCVLDEAEVLTLAVSPAARRKGVACALVEGAVALARGAGAAVLWLEVADDNAAALALYARQGFAEAGRRPDYYARAGGQPADARVLRRTLGDALLENDSRA